MACTMENVEKNKVKLTIDVGGETFEASIQNAYQKTKSRYSVPGFRKGKVPRKVIENYYGAGIFYEEAFNDLFPKEYKKAVEETGIDPVDRPELDIEKMERDGVIFTALVTVKPEVTLGQTTGIEVAAVDHTVSDQAVDDQIEKMRDRAARWENAEGRPVQNGDQILFDYAGSIDGVAFQGGTAEKQMLEIGSNRFIPGFEEQLIGMEIGQEKDIEVTFPEDYHAEDLKGKKAVFACRIHEVKQKDLPELDDEFAKDVSEFDTLDQFRDDLRDKMIKQTQQEAENQENNSIIKAVVDSAEVEIPDCMVEAQLDYMIQDMEYRLSYQGMRFEDYLKFSGMDITQLREQYRADAYTRVKTQLVMEALQQKEQIQSDEESFSQAAEKIAQQAGKTLEEYLSSIGEQERSYIEQEVIADKTIAFLRLNNKRVDSK